MAMISKRPRRTVRAGESVRKKLRREAMAACGLLSMETTNPPFARRVYLNLQASGAQSLACRGRCASDSLFADAIAPASPEAGLLGQKFAVYSTARLLI